MASENKRLAAANSGKQLEWCEDRATSLNMAGEEMLHQCRHENGHPGHEHQCWLCTFTWYTEVPC